MSLFARSRILCGALVLLGACVTAGSGSARAGPPPRAGSFLVATRGQPGVFAHSVVFLIATGAQGALGVIVNRPTKIRLGKALVNPGDLAGHAAPLYFGGPVALDHLTLLIRSHTQPPDAVHVVGDIYSGGSAETLRAITGKSFKAAAFRGYAGYAGWAPGQLEDEIARGGWKVLPSSDNDVFTTEPTQLWEKLIREPALRLVQTSFPRVEQARRAGPQGE